MTNVDILSGATAGSKSLSVATTAGPGALILVYRGLFYLGSLTLPDTAGPYTVPLTFPLAEGDIVQCSITERGNGCGLPMRVSASPRPTGWSEPQTVTVQNAAGATATVTRQQYIDTYGEAPAPAYTPDRALPPIAFPGENVAAPVITPTATPAVSFALDTLREPGLATLAVSQVQNAAGDPLVRWKTGAGAWSAWSSDLTKTYTASGTITVQVKGSAQPDSAATSRTLTLTVPGVPPPVDTGIASMAARQFTNDSRNLNLIMIYVNAAQPSLVQLQLRPASGSPGPWVTINSYDIAFGERQFAGVAAGSYTVAGKIGASGPEYTIPLTVQPW